MIPSLATDVVNSIGVNVHMFFNFGVYHPNYQRVGRLLNLLGIKHIRDGHNTGRSDAVTAWNHLFDTYGIKITLIEDYRADGPTVAARQAEWPSIRGIEALEGPNEINSSEAFAEPPAPAPAWVATTANWMTQLRSARTTTLPGVPVLGPAFTNWQAYEYWRLQGGGALEDVSNIHPYPGGKVPSADLDTAITDEVQRVHPGAVGTFPYQQTETGYHSAWRAGSGHVGVPEPVSGQYAIPLILEAWLRKCQRSFFYELIDEGNNRADENAAESLFGLARYRTYNSTDDFVLKPIGNAIRNLIALLARPSTTTTPDIAVTVTGTGIRFLLTRRGDGKYVLLLWRLASLWDTTLRASGYIQPPTQVVASVTLPAGVTSADFGWVRESPAPIGTFAITSATPFNTSVPSDDVVSITFS